MRLTWDQFIHAPLKSLPRSALLVPVAASLLVHGGLLAAIIYLKWDPFARPEHISDAPPETDLTLAPPAPPPAPVPVVAPAPEPVKAPEPVVVKAPMPDELAPPAPKADERPEPAPGVVQPSAPPPPPPVSTPTHVAASLPPGPVSFAGVHAARARRVVYVVDASGAMTTSLRFVKEELARSISRLDAGQSFQIIVFRELQTTKEGAPAVEMLPFGDGGLIPVTGEARVSSAAWLAGIQPGGRSEPLEGLTAALKLKPDLIFLLTRSIRRSGSTTEWGAGTAATLSALDQLNPVGRNGLRPTVIKAIQFLDEDPTGLLPAIVNAHGDGPGSYMVLRLEEIAK